MTETLGFLLAEAAATLSRAGFAEPQRRARRLVAAALDLTPTELFAHPEQVLDEEKNPTTPTYTFSTRNNTCDKQ